MGIQVVTYRTIFQQIRVASMSNGDFISFLRDVLIFLCENANSFVRSIVSSILLTGVVMSSLFNRCVSFQVGSILSYFARSFSHFIPEFISSVSSCLCFSPPSRPFSSVIGFHPTPFHFCDASAISSFFCNR